jgi:hypothetical protein
MGNNDRAHTLVALGDRLWLLSEPALELTLQHVAAVVVPGTWIVHEVCINICIYNIVVKNAEYMTSMCGLSDITLRGHVRSGAEAEEAATVNFR